MWLFRGAYIMTDPNVVIFVGESCGCSAVRIP